MAKFVGRMFYKMVEKGDNERLATQAVPEGVETTERTYLDDGHVHHKLNIYRASNDGKAPVIIDVHGGGWFYGDKELNRNYDKTLAKGGFTVVAPSYRLAFEVNYVEQLKDVFKAFEWVLNNAEKENFDLDNLFLTGDSAGAHLAALALNCLLDKETAKKFGVTPVDIKFKAVAYTCGAFLLGDMTKIFGAGLYFREIIGKGYHRSPYCKLANVKETLPDSYIPVRFISADGDFLSKAVLSTYELFKEKGFDPDITYFKKEDQKNELKHVYNIIQPYWEESKEANDKTLAFFKKYLG